MEKLKFPIIKGLIPKAKHFSMDDYLKFVILNLKYTTDREANRKQKKALIVTAPFSLK